MDGVPILGNASAIEQVDYDEILICSLPGLNIIREQLIKKGIPSEKISSEFIDTQVNSRLNFLQDWVDINSGLLNCELCVAEGGVFQGEFAKEISKFFPAQKFYLFDTFEGFSEKDIITEKKEGFSVLEERHLSITSEKMVLGKLPHPEKAIIRKGYFPDTVFGIEDEQFIFVNLDFDLYNPIFEGLKFFYPRLVKGGCILVHDYFNPGYKGVKEAVERFENENGGLIKFPIGDHCSIGIIKKE